MARNFKTLYDDDAAGSDSSALVQKFYVKEEASRGVFVTPASTDFIFTMPGSSVNFSRPVASSDHRSGRGHLKVNKQKSITNFTLSTGFNIDTTLGAAGAAEIDLGMRWLHKSLFGTEDTAAGPKYTRGTPSTFATILENGDVWGKQSVGSFVMTSAWDLPGDGNAKQEWTGNAKTTVYAGIAKLTTADHDGANTFIVESGQGKRFQVNARIMFIEADGSTRSADSPDGTPRVITSITGDSIVTDGAVFADLDASGAEIFAAFYEPETAVAPINDEIVGLDGSLTIAGFTALNCIKSLNLTFDNGHKLQDDCFGESGLGGSLFVAGGRMTIGVNMDINLNATLLGFINQIIDDVTGEDIAIVLGDTSTRHLAIDMDRVIFNVPEVTPPAEGDIPVSLASAAVVQSALEADDEITVEYK